MYRVLTFLLLSFLSLPLLSQDPETASGKNTAATAPHRYAAVYTPADRKVYRTVLLDLLKQPKGSTLAQLTVEAAKSRMGTPYVAGTLEFEPERFIVNLHETDCILFVESCLAMALNAREPQPSFNAFCDRLRNLRYRRGRVEGYVSRIHYTSEWIVQAAAQGCLSEISRDMGGQALDQHFHYMTAHAGRYKQLAEDPHAVERIAEIEKHLEQSRYYYLPKETLSQKDIDKIRPGDILCFTSKTEGLDIAHVAIACQGPNRQMTFIHASSAAGKVIVEKKTLLQYVRQSDGISGLRVLRLSD